MVMANDSSSPRQLQRSLAGVPPTTSTARIKEAQFSLTGQREEQSCYHEVNSYAETFTPKEMAWVGGVIEGFA